MSHFLPLGFLSMGLPLALLAGLAPAEETHLGAYLGTIEGLSKPLAVTFGPRRVPGGSPAAPGALWVAEAGDRSAPPAVRALEVAGPSFDGHVPAKVLEVVGAGLLDHPSSVAVDGAGNVYVTDDVQHALWQFPKTGPPRKLGVRGSAAGEFLLPADVEIWPRHAGAARFVAIADRGNRRVQILDVEAGTWIRTAEDASLQSPIAVAFEPPPEGGTLPAGLVVADGSRQRIDLFSPKGTYRSSFSNWGYFPSLVSFPSGIECADGAFFVADSENHRIQAFDGRAPNDPNDGLRYRFGIHAIRPGEGDGRLHYPRDIAINHGASLLAVVEPLDDRIQIFGRGEGPTPPKDPTQIGLGAPSAHLGPMIAASGTYLVTVSPESNVVVAHDLRGEGPIEVSRMFGFGERLGMLRAPVGVDLRGDGRRVTVTDTGNCRLTRATLRVRPKEPIAQDPELELVEDAVNLRVFGIVPGDVTEVHPLGSDPLLAVVDRAADEIVLFNEQLELVRRIGRSEDDPILGIAGIADTPQGTLLVLDGYGVSLGEGAARRHRGRVIELSVEGDRLAVFGEDVLTEPAAVVATANTIWVTDATQDRVFTFARAADTGAIQATGGFGEAGLGRAQFHEPRGLALTADNRLIVLDHGNHRGQLFDLDGNFLAGFGGRLYTAPLRQR